MTDAITWRWPPAQIVLSDAEVHIWRASLNAPATADALRALLSTDEQARADRFRFPKDRRHSIITHGLLRLLLARYLNAPPDGIRFALNQYGKPALCVARFPATPLKFNLSHSGEFVLFAFAHRELGIDLEWTQRTLYEPEKLAERYFSAVENETLRRLPSTQKRAGFFNAWTRKEAYIKAKGRGLSLPLEQFDVSLAPGEPAQLLATRNDPPDAVRWTMRAFTPAPEYVAALVVAGADWETRYWDADGGGAEKTVVV